MKGNMTIGEFLESGIVLEGWYRVQCWETEDNPTIYYEGYYLHSEFERSIYWNREIAYIFPYNAGGSTPGITIELAEE